MSKTIIYLPTGGYESDFKPFKAFSVEIRSCMMIVLFLQIPAPKLYAHELPPIPAFLIKQFLSHSPKSGIELDGSSLFPCDELPPLLLLELCDVAFILDTIATPEP